MVIPPSVQFLFMEAGKDSRVPFPCAKGKSPNSPHHEVFSASHASHLDTRVRRFFYRPDRLAERYVQPGDLVLDFGCGPGFFTREFAKRTGDTGKVFAVDLQAEMLVILTKKLEPEGLMPRIRTHQCAPDTIGLSPEFDSRIDIAFTIFVVHEVPDFKKLFREIHSLLVPGGRLFLSEPPFVVPKEEFRTTLMSAEEAGFEVIDTSWFFVNRAAVLKKSV
jgi:ubiquinone/menaquinone biosynthesis C-methylase UbiE